MVKQSCLAPFLKFGYFMHNNRCRSTLNRKHFVCNEIKPGMALSNKIHALKVQIPLFVIISGEGISLLDNNIR